MKKTLFSILLCAVVGVSMGQITIWHEKAYSPFNQYKLSDVDSITVSMTTYLTVKQKNIQLCVGQSYTPQYVVYPSGEPVYMISSDENVVKTNGQKLLGVSKGETDVFIRAGYNTEKVHVIVGDAAINMTVPDLMRVGECMPISAEVYGATNYFWEVSPKGLAEVSEDGRLCASKCGTITLSAVADKPNVQKEYPWRNTVTIDIVAQDQPNVPTMEELTQNINIESRVVLCVYFKQPACNEVVFYSLENNQTRGLTPVDNDKYPGWYKVSMPLQSAKGTFVQLSSKGYQNWDFQTGDASTWEYVGGRTALIESQDTYAGILTMPRGGAYIYRSKAFINNDCSKIDEVYAWQEVCRDKTFLSWRDKVAKNISQDSLQKLINYYNQQWVKDTIAWYNATFNKTCRDSVYYVPVSGKTGYYNAIFPVSTETVAPIDCHMEWLPLDGMPQRKAKTSYIPDDFIYDPIKESQLTVWLKNYRETFSLETIDSITWHPYHTKSITFNTKVDTIQMPNYAEFKDNAVPSAFYAMEPYYSSDSVWLDVQDPSLFEYKMERGYVLFSPLKKGATDITIHSGNASDTKHIIIIDPFVNPTENPDEIFADVYSRMILTGKVMPAGYPDITNIDEAVTGFYRTLWYLNELSADHLWYIWSDPGIPQLRTNTWDSNNSLIESLFRRLYYNVNLCNKYLYFTKDKTDQTTTAKRAEARFMRAFYYSYLLDLYGNVAIIDEPCLATEPAQNTRTEVFHFVVDELKACLTDLPDAGSRASYYRVDKAAAWVLLSRVYLNGAVYTGGTSFYDEAAQYAAMVINDSHYQLATEYKHLFAGDNDAEHFNYGNTAAQEIIFASDNNSQTAYSYGGSTAVISATRDYGMPDYGLNAGWTCARSKPTLVSLFASLNDAPNIKEECVANAVGDDRAILCSYYNNKSWKVRGLRSGNGTDAFYDCWAVTKWTNVGYSSSYSPSSQEWAETDIPMMRKAEAYLTYAEALTRGGRQQGTLTALDAINTLRRRANATTLTSLSLDNLIDEWGREFYAEGRRRSDLIRFGRFGGQNTYNWEGKGGKNDGVKSTFPAEYNLFPLPHNVLQQTPSWKQNSGYTD